MRKKFLPMILVLACSIALGGCSEKSSSEKPTETASSKTEKPTETPDPTQKIAETEYSMGSIKYKAFEDYSYDEEKPTRHFHIKQLDDTSNVIELQGFNYDTSTAQDEMITAVYDAMYSNWNMDDKKSETINDIDFTICKWSIKGTPTAGSVSEEYNLDTAYSAAFFNGDNIYSIDLLFKGDNCIEEDFEKLLENIELSDTSLNLTPTSAYASSTNRDDFNTGITYDNIARNPDDYQNQFVKFTGTVLQVLEDDSEVQVRIAVDDDYDKIIYCSYNPSIVSSRILENDTITIYGTSIGLLSYDSVLGGQVTIPGIVVWVIDQ